MVTRCTSWAYVAAVLLLTGVSTTTAKYGGGTGEPNDPYQIATAADLIALGETPEDYDKHFILTADIDLDPNLPGRKVFDRAVIAPLVMSGDRWVGTSFLGVFDGKGHAVSNLMIKGNEYLGLFGDLGSGAEVKNLGVVDAEVAGSYDVGGLVGFSAGDVSRCYSTGVVSGDWDVGGLEGKNYDGTVISCHSTAVVSGVRESSRNIGGLLGSNGSPGLHVDIGGSVIKCYSTGLINGDCAAGGLVGSNVGDVIQCHSSGDVSANSSVGGLAGANVGTVAACYSTGIVSGGLYVGGLVGDNGFTMKSGSYAVRSWGSISSSFSMSNVAGASIVGGLVGSNSSDVTQCYSTGRVDANDHVGGLVGRNNYGILTQCYSAGAVAGSEFVGGLVGHNESTQGEEGFVGQSFWDIQTSGQATSAGGSGKTTAEMQDPNTLMAVGWDFVGQSDGPDDIWAEPEGGGYPILWWQLPPLQGLPRFSGGTGEPNDPYTISTAAELNSIGQNPRLMGCHFALANDLDLVGLGFYPIGSWDFPYVGVFDGKGHTISHLTGSNGLFDQLGCGAHVRNVGVVDVSIVGWGWGGGLVGTNGGQVTNCYSSGSIKGYLGGGLVGTNYGSIAACYSTASVSGERWVGGLVGENSGSIVACHSTGAVSGNEHVGGLVGSGGGTVTASFWDTQTSAATWSYGGTGKTTAEMQTAKTFLDAGWDFVGETKNGTEDIWWIDEGLDYPRLWWETTEE